MEPNDLVKGLGRAIASRRKAANLTQEKLAEVAETSPKWISEVERGVGWPSLEMLAGIAHAVGTTTVELLVEAEHAPSARPDVQVLREIAEGLPDTEVRILVATAKAMWREHGPRDTARDVPIAEDGIPVNRGIQTPQE